MDVRSGTGMISWPLAKICSIEAAMTIVELSELWRGERTVGQLRGSASATLSVASSNFAIPHAGSCMLSSKRGRTRSHEVAANGYHARFVTRNSLTRKVKKND